MTAKPPPVPPDQRSPKGPGGAEATKAGEAGRDKDKNLAEQGRQGNLKQNTTNQGYQQDR